jgi:hypothetical protein
MENGKRVGEDEGIDILQCGLMMKLNGL